MAPKRPTPLEDPPSASSSSEDEEIPASDEEIEEEEEDHEEEVDDDGEEEEEAVEAAPHSSVVAAASFPTVQKPGMSDSEDESDDNDDSTSPMKTVTKPEADSDESDESPIDPTPLEAVEAAKKTTKESSKSATTVAKAAVKADGKKKGTKIESESTESKKRNKSVEDSKTQGQRVFSAESEEEILKGMAEFVDENGKDFMSDQNGFYEYVKEELGGEFSKSQLITKVRNLKKKYRKNDEKVKNGEELKAREQKLYDLSKKIWGSGSGGEKSVSNGGGTDLAAKSNGQRKRPKRENIVIDGKKGNAPHSDIEVAEPGDASLSRLVEMAKSKLDFDHGLSLELVIRGLSLIDKSKRVEMVREWEILLRDESELNLRRLELAQEQGQLAQDALRASSH